MPPSKDDGRVAALPVPKNRRPHPESDGRDQRYGFRAATTTLSAPNVFVMRFVLSEEDFAK